MKILSYGLIGFSSPQIAMASTNIDIDRAWMRISDPLIMSTSINFRFSDLPLRGKVSDPERYWSSDYWARYKGGINYRWNAARPFLWLSRKPSSFTGLFSRLPEILN